jgi:DNA polymerase-2
VARSLLGEGKDMPRGGPTKVAEIRRRFHEDPLRLAAYNLRDSQLVSAIFERTRLLDVLTTRALLTGMLLDRQGRSVAAFEHFYLPRLHRQGFVAPDRDDVSAQGQAAGGLVLPPVPGLHDHVVVLDFSSLYPSIIRTFSIDPLSRLRAEDDPVETPVGSVFSRKHHILPEFVEELTARREQARRDGNAPLAYAIKILMNSFYGVMGTPSCRLYHPDLPSSITGTGQWVLRTTRDILVDWGYRVLYGDTDSVFVQLKPGEVCEAPRSGESLASRVTSVLETLLREQYAVRSALVLRLERHYLKLYLPAGRGRALGASKRYAGLVQDAAREQALDVRGMESVRSDWTPLARRFQRELLRRFLLQEDLCSWTREVVRDLRAGRLDRELIYRKRLRRDLHAYRGPQPPHVQAARKLPEAERAGLDRVEYVITRRGPVPVQLPHGDLDYEHYLHHQLQPLAGDVLNMAGLSFDNLVDGQLELWDRDRQGSKAAT